VQPPFVAPPTDGTRRRRGWAIGLSIGAVVAICALGVAAIVGLGFLLVRVVQDEAKASVVSYLSALRDEDYETAYALLCDDQQASTSERQFEREQRDGPAVVGFEVDDVEITERFEVPAQVSYDNGERESVRFIVEQDPTTGGFEVCGVAD
jgi:hypothetical protein